MNTEINKIQDDDVGKPVTIGIPNRMGWIVHAIIWVVLLIFPFIFFNRNTDEVSFSGYLRYLTMLSGIIIVFYVNYLYLVKRYLFSRQMWHFLIANLLLFTAVIMLSHFLMEMIPPDEGYRPHPHDRQSMIIRFTVFDYIKYMFIAALSVALKMTNSWYKAEAERKELEKMRSEAELQNLKSQLNPHFLFNTLNNIYSLIAISSDRAQEAIHLLGSLLRYMLYESSHLFVPIGKDIDFVHNYIELMRIRLPQNVEVKIDIQTLAPGAQIAPLLLISLVENAFKHGISNNKPCFIDVSITSDVGHIKCLIRNSYFPKSEEDKSGSGIGIVNLRKRLDLLYSGSYKFKCEREGDIFISELIIELK